MKNIDHLVAMQCTDGKPWVLAFLMDVTWHIPSTQTLSRKKCTHPWQQNSQMAVCAPSQDRTMGPSTEIWMAQGMCHRAKDVNLASKFTSSQPGQASMGLPEKSSGRRRDCTCCGVGWITCVKWFLHGCREPFPSRTMHCKIINVIYFTVRSTEDWQRASSYGVTTTTWRSTSAKPMRQSFQLHIKKRAKRQLLTKNRQ